MANSILPKFTTSAALTITLASLASSTTGVGRQSDVVDNATNRYQRIRVFVKVKLGTSPTANRSINVYAIRSDKDATTPHRSDGAGATDAGLTVLNAQIIGVISLKSAPATGDVVYGEFMFEDPGPQWGIAIVHDTGAALDSTGSNHWVRWIGESPEIQ